jgi:hypothetical protein
MHTPTTAGVYLARAAQHATMMAIKETEAAKESNHNHNTLQYTITKLTNTLTTLSEHTKKPVDVWLDPHAAPFRLLAMKRNNEQSMNNLLRTLKFTRNKLTNTIHSAIKLLTNQKRNQRMEAEMNKLNATKESIWKVASKTPNKNGTCRDIPLQTFDSNGNVTGTITNPHEQIKMAQ